MILQDICSSWVSGYVLSNIFPANIFPNLPLPEIYHQNCQAVISSCEH